MEKKHFGHIIMNYICYVMVISGSVFLLGSCKDTEKPEEIIVPPDPVSLSPKAEIYDTQVASEWNDLHLNLIKNSPSRTSLSAARSLGYVNLALYESLVNGTENESLTNRLRGFSGIPETIDTLEYNWGLAANVAQYTLIQTFFPDATVDENTQIDALLSKYEIAFRTNSSQEVIKRSIEFGASVANAVWSYARRDGLNGTDSLLFDENYIFPDGLGVWKPEQPQIKPLLPQWKLLRPLIFENKYFTATGNIPFSYREQIRVQGRNEISVAELRELPLAEQLICTAYQVNKFYKKGGLFRFLWHGNNWLIAFGQSLDFVDKDWTKTYKKLIAEIAFLEDDTFQYTNVDWEKVYPFPEGTKSYDSLTLFENTFDLNQYLLAIISLTIKTAHRTGL